MRISLTLETVWEMIVALYYTSTVPVRFVYIYWIVFAFLYLFMGSYEEKHKHIPKRKIKKHNNPGTLYIFGVIALLLHHGSLNWRWMFYSKICPSGHFFALGVCGFFFMTVGICLVALGRRDIDGLWGVHVFQYDEKEKDRAILVTDGIFRHCRHPIYAGQIAMTVGTMCLGNNWWVLILPVGTIAFCIWRAKVEEQDLLERFNDAFTEYKNTTSFIVPFIAGKRDDD